MLLAAMVGLPMQTRAQVAVPSILPSPLIIDPELTPRSRTTSPNPAVWNPALANDNYLRLPYSRVTTHVDNGDEYSGTAYGLSFADESWIQEATGEFFTRASITGSFAEIVQNAGADVGALRDEAAINLGVGLVETVGLGMRQTRSSRNNTTSHREVSGKTFGFALRPFGDLHIGYSGGKEELIERDPVTQTELQRSSRPVASWGVGWIESIEAGAIALEYTEETKAAFPSSPSYDEQRLRSWQLKAEAYAFLLSLGKYSLDRGIDGSVSLADADLGYTFGSEKSGLVLIYHEERGTRGTGEKITTRSGGILYYVQYH